jgi:hypothetical protein
MGSATVTFKDSWTTVTPGQAGVLYDLANQEVLAGGTISTAQQATTAGLRSKGSGDTAFL